MKTYNSNEKNENIEFSMDVPNVILTRGPAGSGKSTWGSQYLGYLFNEKKVTGISNNRDFWRSEMFGEEYHTKSPVRECEEQVTEHQRKILKEAMELNVPVVIDDTNLNEKLFNDLLSFIYSINEDTNVVIVEFHTDLETCLKYNQQRDRNVPEHIIRAMHQKFHEKR